MTGFKVRLACLVSAVTLLSTACATHHHATALPPTGQQATTAPASPTPSLPHTTTVAPAVTTAEIARSAFGMHVVGFGALPQPFALNYGSARIWDMGVTWDKLQPHGSAWDQATLARLDGIVATMHAHHVDPLLVLGMTPGWAARHCHHGSHPRQTCGPRSTGTRSAWGDYVRALVTRYDGHHGHPKVTYFETWNEANLSYGWNDSLAELAAIQGTAYRIVHGHHARQRLLSPSWATSFGFAPTPTSWIDTFLGLPGGRSFDVFNVHLYPTIQMAKAGIGPEWEIDRLKAVRGVLALDDLRPTIWDTETNVGSGLLKVRFPGTSGSALVARVLLLATQNGVGRSFWYAANEQNFGGVWLQTAAGQTATPGVTYRWLARFLTGARPGGCTVTAVGKGRHDYTCRYALKDGRGMLALWTTGPRHDYTAPTGTEGWYGVTGAHHDAQDGSHLTVTSTPKFVVGSFPA